MSILLPNGVTPHVRLLARLLAVALALAWAPVPAVGAEGVPEAPAQSSPQSSAAPTSGTDALPASPTLSAPAAPAGQGENPSFPVFPSPHAAGVFQAAAVENRARELAAKPYEDPAGQVPEFWRSLKPEQWQAIRFQPAATLWKAEGLPFEVRFFHPGSIYNRTAIMHVVEGNRSEVLPFSPDLFSYGDPGLADKARGLNFAGFSLAFPLRSPDVKEEIATFLGASYFQSVSRHGRYGQFARGLALNTAMADGEEFPYFREFWLVKPRPDAESLTLYALMDSPSMTGAFRFVIAPGTSVIMDVDSKLFLREGAAVPQKIGLAPMTGMFLFSETGNGMPGDYRPEVHNVDGLLFADGDNDWAWSPLANPGRLAVNTFAMRNPRGFGLMQRDDNFDHYQDIAARYDRRSSLWVEPKGDWGTGRLELIEIPAKEEIHANIVAFWVPEEAKEAAFGPDAAANGKPAELAYSYRLYWMDPGVTPHELGKAVATRMVRSPKGDTVRFLIDFEGPALNLLPPDTGLASMIETPEDAPLLDRQLEKNPVTGGWRLSFRVRLPKQEGVVQSILSAREGSPRLRFRVLLKKGENLPNPLTEMWIYDLPS